jgi:hypothetical protein
MTQWEYGYVTIIDRNTEMPESQGWTIGWETTGGGHERKYAGLLHMSKVIDFINQLGDDHWEAIGYQSLGGTDRYLFKRPRISR